MSAPLLPTLFVSHWELSPPLDVELAVGAGLYLAAVARVGSRWRLRRTASRAGSRWPLRRTASRAGSRWPLRRTASRAGSRWPLRRTASFLGGLGAIAVALQSGLDTYDDQLLSVHMTQHMVLLLVAPLLLLCGRPVILALRALPPAPRSRLLRLLPRLRAVSGPWRGLALYGLVLCLTHTSWFYDQTLSHPLLHQAEHALFVLAGALMLWPILDGDPVPSQRLGGLGKLGYVLVAMVPMAVVGAYLNRHTSVIYAPYAPAARALGISAVNDQATAGAIMWVVGNTIMVLIGLWAVVDAMVREERRQQAREARAGSLLHDASAGSLLHDASAGSLLHDASAEKVTG